MIRYCGRPQVLGSCWEAARFIKHGKCRVKRPTLHGLAAPRLNCNEDIRECKATFFEERSDILLVSHDFHTISLLISSRTHAFERFVKCICRRRLLSQMADRSGTAANSQLRDLIGFTPEVEPFATAEVRHPGQAQMQAITLFVVKKSSSPGDQAIQQSSNPAIVL